MSLSSAPIDPPALDPSKALEASKLLKAMANENRLLILCLLGSNELSVTEINAQIKLSQSALSQHLAVLRKDELVKTRRDSQVIYYSLKDEIPKQIINVLQSNYCPERLD